MSIVGLPDGYAELLAAVKADVHGTKLRVARAANNEMLALYWRVGQLILERQGVQGWGSKVIARLSADLRREFPDQRDGGRAAWLRCGGSRRRGRTRQFSKGLLEDCRGATWSRC